MMEDIILNKYRNYSASALRSLIIKNNKQSDEAAFYLIRYRMLATFTSIYNDYNNLPDELGDVLNDFLLYLRNGKTGQNTIPYKGLHGIISGLMFSSWLKRVFRNFIFDRNNKNERQKNANNEFYAQDVNNPEVREKQIRDLSLTIAWLHQLSTPDQRFILYRHLMQTICHKDLIDNKKVADALGLTYGNYRTRNSRLSDKIHELASDIQNGVHSRLDNYHAMLANQIDECFGQLDTLLKSLYEKNLSKTTHWETIQVLRIEDQLERAKALQASRELDIPGARFSLKNPNGEVKYSLPTEPLNSNDDPQPSFCFEDDINFSLGKKKTTITFDQDSDKQEKTKSTNLFDFSDLSPRKTALKRFRESI